MYKFKIIDNIAYIKYESTDIIKLDSNNLDKFMFIKNCKYKIPQWFLDESNNLLFS